MRCSTPGCECGGELHMYPKCHPEQGVSVVYHEGVLTLQCFECDREMGRVAVSDGDHPVTGAAN
jgi:hypothetical protein